MIHNAIINITNLRLRTYIGFNEEEKQKQQDIIINAEYIIQPITCALEMMLRMH